MSAGAGKGLGEEILKIIVIVMGIIGLIALPLGAYMIATMLAYHLALSDLTQAYSAGGLMAVIYNATHISQYNQMATVFPAFGSTIANTDVTTLQMLALSLGLLLDVPLAVVIYKVYSEI